jgi:hypothetical protein
MAATTPILENFGWRMFVLCNFLLAKGGRRPNGELKYLWSDTEVSDEMLLHIIASVVKTAKRVGNRAQLAVLGTDNFRLLYSGSRVDYTPKYFADLHNKQVTLLQRALKYMKRGIDVPIRFDTSVLLSIGEQPPTSSDTSMMMECDDDDDDNYTFSLELVMGRENESLCIEQGAYFNIVDI